MKYKPMHYNYIWKLSWLHLPSTIYAINRGYYGSAFLLGTTCLTSLNYWRKPELGWRRNLDMTCVYITLGYNLITAYTYSNKYVFQYYCLMALGVSNYPISIYFYNNNKIWTATILHGFVHIFAFIGNNLLYSG
jgi:hypothetical protein